VAAKAAEFPVRQNLNQGVKVSFLWFISGMIIGWMVIDHLYAWWKFYRDRRSYDERYYGRYGDYFNREDVE